MKSHSEVRLATLVDKVALVREKHEDVVRSLGAEAPTAAQKDLIETYKREATDLDGEIEALVETIESDRKAAEQSKIVAGLLARSTPGVEPTDEGIAYSSFAVYARDAILAMDESGLSAVRQSAGRDAVIAAKERIELLNRTPASNIVTGMAGISVAQHLDQIFQVIDKSRPIVANSEVVGLDRGTLTYPKVAQRPVVAVQASELAEGGNQALQVTLQSMAASVYLGGGYLSWQSINWTTPDALRLWFDLAAANYALKTEQAAAKTLIDSAFGHVLGSTVNMTSGTFANFLTAVGAGIAAVFTNSGRTADTIYLSVDSYAYLLGLTSAAFSQFISVDGSNVGPLKLVPSRGLDAATVIVGDSSGLVVGETPGAPVELSVTRAATAGAEVGIVGAFASAVVDDGAFCQISTAS